MKTLFNKRNKQSGAALVYALFFSGVVGVFSFVGSNVVTQKVSYIKTAALVGDFKDMQRYVNVKFDCDKTRELSTARTGVFLYDADGEKLFTPKADDGTMIHGAWLIKAQYSFTDSKKIVLQARNLEKSQSTFRAYVPLSTVEC